MVTGKPGTGATLESENRRTTSDPVLCNSYPSQLTGHSGRSFGSVTTLTTSPGAEGQDERELAAVSRPLFQAQTSNGTNATMTPRSSARLPAYSFAPVRPLPDEKERQTCDDQKRDDEKDQEPEARRLQPCVHLTIMTDSPIRMPSPRAISTTAALQVEGHSAALPQP